MTEFVVRVAELEGDIGLETAGLVLQCPKLLQMVDPVTVVLDVAVEHGGIGAHPEIVPNLVDPEPLLAAALASGDLIADLIGKDLGTAPGHAVQSGFLHQPHPLLVADLRFLKDVVVLYGREGLDVQFRPVGLDAPEKLGVKGDVILR